MFRRTVLALIVAIPLAAPALAQEDGPPRLVSLSGHGQVSVVPDMAVVSLGVTSDAASAAEALTANNRAMTAVMAVLTAAGIAERDIQTGSFSVQPRYEYLESQPPRLAGYQVANTVSAKVRDLAGLGRVLDDVVKAGSNQINGISFEVADPARALDEARRRAMADATRKAKLYAAGLAIALGPVVSVSEAVAYPPPPPIFQRGLATEAVASEVPVAPGQQDLAVDVNIAWEIRL